MIVPMRREIKLSEVVSGTDEIAILTLLITACRFLERQSALPRIEARIPSLKHQEELEVRRRD
jgi:hypothetical protein